MTSPLPNSLPPPLPAEPQRVFVVDDDEAFRVTVGKALRSAGFRVECFANALDCLEPAVAQAPDCIVLDLRMPRVSGLRVQRILAERGVESPLIFLTGRAGVSDAVDALQHGAFDFLEKPVTAAQLVERIRAAIEHSVLQRAWRREREAAAATLAGLGAREREVCSLLARGLPSKLIAQQMGISIRTVEHHRARILKKCGADSAADLVRLTLLAEELERSRSLTAMRADPSAQ
jgi:FixJ family two-component response regulator